MTQSQKILNMHQIEKVAVLGSGVMGSGIAAHLANIGLEVIMLDIVPFNLTEDQKKDPNVRNSIVNGALKAATKSKPAAFYDKKFVSRIATGNFDDDFDKINDCDWIIEVVIERLDIKQQIFEKVDNIRKKGSLVSSNTSGIPIHMMTEGRSEDFKKNFLGTHFFNPPRYLRLLEIIPTKDTDPAVVDFFMDYGDRYLGKQTVLCKDSPAFIANRVGVYLMGKGMELTKEMGLDVTEVDKLTGPAIGRPKTGSYRLGDLVGLDVMDKVVKGLKANCPDDADVQKLNLPPFFHYLIENKFLGNKTKQGFYKKTGKRDANGRPIILGLNLQSNEYEETKPAKIASLGVAKQIDNLEKRIRSLYDADDKGGEFIKRRFGSMFSYVSKRVPEITDSIYNIDFAMAAGFAWELGPFEYWDVIGVQKGIDDAISQGESVAEWVKEMVASGNQSFYKSENGVRLCYNPASKSYEALPGGDSFIILDNHREKAAVYKNDEVTLHDIGDGVLCLEFTSKMNSIGEGVLKGMQESIRIAEEDGWKGIVIGNNAQNFSVGANLMLIGMFAFQQQFDDLNMAVKLFQDTTMRCRYSSIPVVAATQGFVFGGGCETMMHCDSAMVAAESYVGLVEVGVGLIPGGGGTKEFALRASDSFFEGDVMMPTLIEKFKTIATAAVATSAQEAYNYGYMIEGKDHVVMNAKRNIAEAKKKVLHLSDGYKMPMRRKDIKVLGQAGMATLYAAAHSLKLGKYASEHDIKIAHKIAYVLCGGDLSEATLVSEQYLLDIEREAFLSLAGEQKTLERIQHMLEKNKPLRN